MGPPFKRALKFLAADHLKRIIQNDGEGVRLNLCEIKNPMFRIRDILVLIRIRTKIFSDF
jgi:hypothetical protein